MLRDRIRDDLNSARRGRDKLRTTLLTTLLAEARNREIEVGREIEDAEWEAVVRSAVKKRREAAEQMRAGGREELAAREDQEAALLTGYLPQQLGEDEVRAMIREAVAEGATNLGAVMKAVMPRIAGRFEGGALNRIARETLAGG